MKSRGTFVTFEGGEGSGKSTQIRLLSERLEAAGLEILLLREPGGTQIGEAIRELVLNAEAEEMAPWTELMLYEASRSELTAKVIVPSLEAGKVILCDRFVDSTTAYQGYGRSLSLERIRALNDAATNGLKPDMTIFLDLSPMAGLNRYEGDKRGMHVRQMSLFSDRIERQDLAFHERVREGFLAIAAEEPVRIRVIDAADSIEGVAQRVAEAIADLPALAPWLGRAQ